MGSGKFWVILYITSFSFSRYVAELRNTVAEHKMGHLACFCPGMFALEAGTFYILRLRIIWFLDVEQDVEKKREIMQLAEDLGHTWVLRFFANDL